MSAHDRTVLRIVATDNTFSEQLVRDERCWVGKCIHCNSKLTVDRTGRTLGTIEHIIPRTHGGTDEVENLALACKQCNSEKGVRHDLKARNDPRRLELVEALSQKRRERLREPIFTPPPSPWPTER